MSLFFFFNDTATTEIYTLSLHDALPILRVAVKAGVPSTAGRGCREGGAGTTGEDVSARRPRSPRRRSEEHTSELQSRPHLVCRLLLEKKRTDQSSIDDLRRRWRCFRTRI